MAETKYLYPIARHKQAEELLKGYTRSDTMNLATKLGLFDHDPELKDAGLKWIKEEIAHYLTFPVQLRRL